MPAPRSARTGHEAPDAEPVDSLADARSCPLLAPLAPVVRHPTLSPSIRSLTLAHDGPGTSSRPSRAALSMLVCRLPQVAISAVRPPAATFAANSAHPRTAPAVHWMLVCCGLFFLTSTRTPHRSQVSSSRPP